MIKLITRSLRPLGMILIFIFAVACIICSLLLQDFNHSPYFGRFLEYMTSFESRFYDYRMRNQLDKTAKSKEVVLVKIDDYSLENIGFWPIPRGNYALLIDKLHHFGAKVVAMDILFPEATPETNGVSSDAVFRDAIKNYQNDGGRVFIGYSLANAERESFKEAPFELLDDAILTRNVPEAEFSAQKISKYNFPIQELLASGTGLGYLTAAPDSDGIFRHYKLVANVDTIYYGSLAFNAFESFSGTKHTIGISGDNSGELLINGKKLEISSDGEIHIRYIGSSDHFDSLSFYDVLKAKDDDEAMRKRISGKVIFIGSTAQGAHDYRPSPVDAQMPGVYAHMNVVNMLLKGFFFQSTDDSVKLSLYFLVAGMIVFVFIQRFGHPVIDVLTLLSLLAGSYYVDQSYFIPEGYELRLFYCYFCFISSYLWTTFYNFHQSNREKRQIKGTFARYVAPTIVDEMLKDPEKLHVGGTKMDITCLFSDVRDFTKISEGLSATELAHSLNIYMGEMTNIVFDTKGTLDKYIGDAIVAIWGAPLPIGNHAQHAVEGAIKMMEALPKINEEFRRLGRPEFNVGIGLNSGECSVGNMGSSRIFSYTALGDNMNLGARLEGLCKYYGTQILISEMTLERLDLTNIKTRPIDKVVVKGKTTAVAIYEVLHPHHWMMKDPESLQFYLKACEYFQERKFPEAKNIFDQLLMANESDRPSRRLSDLCEKYISRPELVTNEFDVTTMTEK